MGLNDVRGIGGGVEIDWATFMARACPIVDCWPICLLLGAHLVIVVRARGCMFTEEVRGSFCRCVFGSRHGRMLLA